MSAKTHYTVVRNEACPSSQLSIREGHNERRSKTPLNADVVPERKEFNVHFHQNFTPNGTPETYHQTIDRLLAEKKIVKHNFKPKSAIVDEIIFDVNSEYFEENGGYDFAVRFYEEAYRYAIKEAGSADYIVSAILHADERNVALSEKLGHDVYHYHLHVVYVPVIQKEVRWTKRAAPDLVGKVKETIPQINHTEKWPRKKIGGKFINEYSKLQDRYHAHMTAAGFPNLVRGEFGSKAEHLEVQDYKIQQNKKRLNEQESEISQKQKKADNLDKRLAIKESANADIAALDSLGKKNLAGQIVITPDELKIVKSIVKKEAKTRESNSELRGQITKLNADNSTLKKQLEGYQGKGLSDKTKYFQALERAPRRLADTVADIMRQPPEKATPEITKTRNREVR